MAVTGHNTQPEAGWSVIGSDGQRLGMVSGLAPDADRPTEVLVFVADRRQLIPREFHLPMSTVVRIEDRAVHVTVNGATLNRHERPTEDEGEVDSSPS